VRIVTAFGLLVALSAKNRAVAQARRLKQPRYLAATALGLAYWGLYLGRDLFRMSRAGTTSAPWREASEVAAAGLGLLFLAKAWIFGADRVALTFSEAEIQLLFPAPTTRRALVLFKVLRSMLVSLASSLVFALFFSRPLSGHPLLFTFGFWMALTALSLHGLGASFTRQALLEHGASGVLRRLPTILVLGALGLGLGLALWKAEPLPPFAPTSAFLSAILALADTAPLCWVLAPARAFTRLIFASDASSFGRALPLATGLLALLSLWVLRSDASFEESSLAAAEARARVLETRRSGAPSLRRRREPPFRLKGNGRPEMALVWKSLIAAGRLVNPRVLAVLALPVALGALGVYFVGEGASEVLSMLAVFAALFWAMAVLAGSMVTRADLRSDLRYLDFLRALPLTGRQIVLGEAAGSFVPLVAVQWLLLGFTVGFVGKPFVHWFSLRERCALGLALALAGPAVTLASILVQNAAVILFPAWASVSGERSSGLEARGLTLLVLVGNLLAVAVGIIPAGIVAGMAALALWPTLSMLALPIAALFFACTLAAEAWLAMGMLGHAFERFDPSA